METSQGTFPWTAAKGDGRKLMQRSEAIKGKEEMATVTGDEQGRGGDSGWDTETSRDRRCPVMTANGSQSGFGKPGPRRALLVRRRAR